MASTARLIAKLPLYRLRISITGKGLPQVLIEITLYSPPGTTAENFISSSWDETD